MGDPVDKINVTIEGTKAVVELTLYIPFVGKRTMRFSLDCGSEVSAGLLASALREMLVEALSGIRRHAYQAGYKTGRAKAAQEKWFSGRL